MLCDKQRGFLTYIQENKTLELTLVQYGQVRNALLDGNGGKNGDGRRDTFNVLRELYLTDYYNHFEEK